MYSNIKLFLTSYIQVLLVCINVFFVSHMIGIGVFISSFLLNCLWMFNVGRVSKDFTIIYPIGASLGALSGMYIGKYILVVL